MGCIFRFVGHLLPVCRRPGNMYNYIDSFNRLTAGVSLVSIGSQISCLFFSVEAKKSLIWKRHHCRWKTATHRHLRFAKSDLYRATLAVTRELNWCRPITGTAPILLTIIVPEMFYFTISVRSACVHCALCVHSPFIALCSPLSFTVHKAFSVLFLFPILCTRFLENA